MSTNHLRGGSLGEAEPDGKGKWRNDEMNEINLSILALAWRAIREERTLSAVLPGYDANTRSIR
jgi:hypothetical protein